MVIVTTAGFLREWSQGELRLNIVYGFFMLAFALGFSC